MKWYQKSYRRNFLDMHISDWNDSFLSEFNSEDFAETLSLSHGTSITLFANTHTGLNYWPSSVGEMHRQGVQRAARKVHRAFCRVEDLPVVGHGKSVRELDPKHQFVPSRRTTKIPDQCECLLVAEVVGEDLVGNDQI